MASFPFCFILNILQSSQLYLCNNPIKQARLMVESPRNIQSIFTWLIVTFCDDVVKCPSHFWLKDIFGGSKIPMQLIGLDWFSFQLQEHKLLSNVLSSLVNSLSGSDFNRLSLTRMLQLIVCEEELSMLVSWRPWCGSIARWDNGLDNERPRIPWAKIEIHSNASNHYTSQNKSYLVLCTAKF